jgi:hypothetical protein
MSDLIRQARALYGPAYDQMLEEAGRIKEEYVGGGGRPEDVYSPERIPVALEQGAAGLTGASRREDGSVAGPYVPTEMALMAGLIEPRAVPAVTDAMNRGITTVSSGTDIDTGKGFAIGRDPEGRVVKVLR